MPGQCGGGCPGAQGHPAPPRVLGTGRVGMSECGAAREGPGTAGSWLPEVPRPASLHLLYAAFQGEPDNSENQLEGSL